MKKLSKKAIALISSLIIVISVTIGVTVAYLTAKTPPLENNFTPVAVSCVVENGDTGGGYSNVTVKNTGDVKAYARCVVIATWVNDSNGSVYATAPIQGVDFKLVKGSDSWVLGGDGFYYYTVNVAPTTSTMALISSVVEVNSAPKGYSLKINVFASMLQAEPATAIEQVWNVTVLNNGTLSVN